MDFMNYNFGHDEWHNSARALREHLWSRNGPVRLRAPLSFGPMPSPRQDHHGRAVPAHDSRFTTWSVRVRSSATYLKTLFPAPGFAFSSPGTVAEASFRCTELKGMRWLGGGGYRLLGLWIHGVRYYATTQKKQEEEEDGGAPAVHGSLLVVLFESLADPIITGREELGMPKLFCDIDIDVSESAAAEGKKDGVSARIACSWRGQTFLRMSMDGLAEEEEKETHQPATNTNGSGAEHVGVPPPGPPPKPVEQGTMFYRYIPAVGKPGEADAAYAVLIREGESSGTPRVVEKTCRARESKLEFERGDWTSLPTLHHIAAGLAEIPIYGVVEAKVEEGYGVDDLRSAERID